MPRRRAPETCANCGAAIPPNARACPECGADERTGWDEQSVYDGLDLPDEGDTEEAHRAFTRERRGNSPASPKQWFWWIVGVVLILAIVIGTLGFG